MKSSVQLTSDRIQDTLYAFMRSQILFTAIDLDVFSSIARGDNQLETLQARLGLNERGLRLLLNGLVGIGFLKVAAGGVYSLPEDVAHFLVKPEATYIGGMVHHCKWLYENWSMLTDAVSSGQPVGGAQSLAQLEIYFSELVKGLYVSNYPTAQKLAEILEIGSAYRNLEVLDVAGGSAVWSIALLEKDAGSQATVLDFPSVTHVAESYVEQHGLSDRFRYWPGDLEAMDLNGARFDIVVMAHICHMLGPTASQKAFQRLKKVLKPGGRLVVVDFVPDDQRSQKGWPLIFGVNMLITTPEGDVFTGDEYTQWLQAAGFESITLQDIDSDVTVVIAQV
ncbi:class I SAM-dependent methyltransferase [Vampirovibrio chlorellavorus]|uniref:class I SAM-dependent methyltransferase n=1 Tax=Vampirovibrio chlorellavorus TaxID=758823 RepID=UPI0026EB5A52|nr:class I SAM-dependent methyltransferase [Vampirovibrio chlorellavorus]